MFEIWVFEIWVFEIWVPGDEQGNGNKDGQCRCSRLKVRMMVSVCLELALRIKVMRL